MPPKHEMNTGRKSAPAVPKADVQLGHKRIGSTGDETTLKWTRRSQRLMASSAQEEQHKEDEQEEEGEEEDEGAEGAGIAKLGQGLVKKKTGTRGQKAGGRGGKMGGQGGKTVLPSAGPL